MLAPAPTAEFFANAQNRQAMLVAEVRRLKVEREAALVAALHFKDLLRDKLFELAPHHTCIHLDWGPPVAIDKHTRAHPHNPDEVAKDIAACWRCNLEKVLNEQWPASSRSDRGRYTVNPPRARA